MRSFGDGTVSPRRSTRAVDNVPCHSGVRLAEAANAPAQAIDRAEFPTGDLPITKATSRRWPQP